MFLRSFLSGKICLTLAIIIQRIQYFDESTKKLLEKWAKNFGGVIVIELVGLKSKMYSMKNIDGKGCSAAKGVSIATEFDKFIDVLFNEKIIRDKMKRIQSKKHKLGACEIGKISLSCFDNKKYVLDDRICALAYFPKDSVTSCRDSKRLW